MGCPELEALEIEAARIVGLEPPVDLVVVICVGTLTIDPEIGFGNPCDIVLRDQAGNESRHRIEIFSGLSSKPGRSLRVFAAPLGVPPPEDAQEVERAVQALLGIWLIRTMSLDEIAKLSTIGAPCAERYSPAWLATPILRSLSKETGLIIEIIVCGD